MTALSMSSPEPRVELLERELRVYDVSFIGTIVEVAHDLDAQGDPARLTRLLAGAVEVGATVLRNGQSRGLVESVTTEVDRLVATTTSEGAGRAVGRPPTAAVRPVCRVHRSVASASGTTPAQGNRWGPDGRRAVQACSGDPRCGECSRCPTELKSLSSTNADTLDRVNRLLGRIEQKLQFDQAVERSVHKGRTFEEIVQAELEAIHGPLGDDVRCVRATSGLLPKANEGAKAGDYLVAINPEQTRGREVCYVVEVKSGPLGATAARREIRTAIQNRGAVAGVLVFDSLDDAPMGGRSYLPHGGGRFTVVLDPTDGSRLAFEVACREARLAALASVRSEGQLDPVWLETQCDRLCEVIEAASALLRSVSTIERGAADIRHRYQDMRTQALALIDEARERADCGEK